MPQLFRYLGYCIYFWSNENQEPLHIHVCKGKPTANATKIWILENGTPLLQSNSSRIPSSDLSKIYAFIKTNEAFIKIRWNEMFGYLKYYS